MNIKLAFIAMLFFPTIVFSSADYSKDSLLGTWFVATEHKSIEFRTDDTYIYRESGFVSKEGKYELTRKGKELSVLGQSGISLKLENKQTIMKLAGFNLTDTLYKVQQVSSSDLVGGVWYSYIPDKYAGKLAGEYHVYFKYSSDGSYSRTLFYIDHAEKWYSKYTDDGRFIIGDDYAVTEIISSPMMYVILDHTDDELTIKIIDELSEVSVAKKVSAVPDMAPPEGYRVIK